MDRNIEGRYEYDVLAIVTRDKNRVMGGKQLTLLANSEEEQTTIAQEIALTLKAEMVKLKFGDCLVIRA